MSDGHAAPAALSLDFASDNVVGASAPVMAALVRANEGAAASYGADAWSTRVERRFVELFEREVAVFLVATGTAANAVALAALAPPWSMCICHEEAHVAVDECGAPEFFTGGAKLAGLPGIGGKLSADDIAAFVDDLSPSVHQMPASAVTITQSTEAGLVYRTQEVAAIGEVCRGRGLRLHMDGARFANALVATGESPADATWRAGIDILSFGATKNGCLAAEAILVFDRALAGSIAYRRKRAGHTLSKGRLLGAQLEGYLAEGHWLDNARHANRMAARLAAGLAAIPGVRLPWRTEANEVFAILPAALDSALRGAGAVYHPWSLLSLPPGERPGSGEILVRMVASFATREASVDRLLAAATAAA